MLWLDMIWYDYACCAKPAGMLKFSIHPVHFFIARTSLRGQLAILLHLQSTLPSCGYCWWKTLLHQLKIVQTLEFGDMMGYVYINCCRIFTGKRQPIKLPCLWCPVSRQPCRVASCIIFSPYTPRYSKKQLRQKHWTTGYLVPTWPHIFKFSTVQGPTKPSWKNLSTLGCRTSSINSTCLANVQGCTQPGCRIFHQAEKNGHLKRIPGYSSTRKKVVHMS